MDLLKSVVRRPKPEYSITSCTSKDFWEPHELCAHSLRYSSPLNPTSLFCVRHLSPPLLFQPQGRPSILSPIVCLAFSSPFNGLLTLQVHYRYCITHLLFSSFIIITRVTKCVLTYPTLLNFPFLYCSLTVIDRLITYYTRFVGTKAIACT